MHMENKVTCNFFFFWSFLGGKNQLNVCCFVNPILGNRYGPRVIPLQGTWDGRILTIHLNYVAVYTSRLLLLFERNHN